MYYRVWTIGNGGIKSEQGYFDIPDIYGDDNDNIEEYLYNKLSPMCGGTRSFHWEKVERLPDDEINKQISRNEGAIETAKERIQALKEMKKKKIGKKVVII